MSRMYSFMHKVWTGVWTTIIGIMIIIFGPFVTVQLAPDVSHPGCVNGYDGGWPCKQFTHNVTGLIQIGLVATVVFGTLIVGFGIYLWIRNYSEENPASGGR